MMDKLQPVPYSKVPGWTTDDHKSAFKAFLQTAKFHLDVKSYRKKLLPVDQKNFQQVCSDALRLMDNVDFSNTDARAFFEQNFSPFSVEETGFVTGYYEPEVDVRYEKDEQYKYPFYKRPIDLVDIDDPANPPNGVSVGYAFAKKSAQGYSSYPTRQDIDQGYLDQDLLEIAYAKNKADVYFTHIQGSARLKDAKDHIKRISYAAKSGHPYTSIGKILIKRGDIAQSDMSMDRIRQWMEENPSLVDELLWQNESYIFFKELDELDPTFGPVGAAKVQLTSERSLAVDKSIYQFGLPIFISAKDLDISSTQKQFQKLMIAQDTGSAILGASRGDIFVGSGLKAGRTAGSISHKAKFYVLLPK